MFAAYLPPAKIQTRLLQWAGLFLFLHSLALSLSPAAKIHSWQGDWRLSHWAGYLAWALAFSLLNRQMQRHTPEADPYLLPAAALLSGWGLLTIWRLDAAFGLRQMLWLLFSASLVWLGLRHPHNLNLLRRYKYILLSGGLLLTALTLLLGSNPGGAGPRLWLGCCGLYLQPSEPLKLLLLTYLAAYFAGKMPIRTRLLPLIFPTLLLTGLALAILLIQRDLGTASIFIFLYASMLYLASGKRRLLLASLGILLLAALIGYSFVEVIQSRIDTWLNPWADPSGRSYQIVQSILAVASGGLEGRGAGMGAPGLVPVAHSDFIFTSIAEEYGLTGALALLALYSLLIGRGFRVALRAGNPFLRLLAAGIVTYLGVQSILIIGGNLRVLPLTGVTLPFVSYGGSSLLTSFLALLILLQTSNEQDEEPASLPQPRPYLHIAALLWVGLGFCALAAGWWAVWRAEDLLARTDNPRRTIADRYVPRGRLLDRNGAPITITQGQAGNYSRAYLVPELSPVTGYTHPVYGQAGLEESLDAYLRGLQGIPRLEIEWERLLYGQPPPGLDVHLSLDIALQRIADSALGEETGAAVLLNAQTGEILAMASHPWYDANLLDDLGSALGNDESAPLLNRAAQGLYDPKAIFAPFALAKYGRSSLNPEEEAALFRALGWDLAPALPLPVAPVSPANAADLRISPLQAGMAAAALSHAGVCPAAQIALSVLTPHQGSVVLNADQSAQNCLPAEGAARTVERLKTENSLFWRWTGYSGEVSWFTGGTTSHWQGVPLAAVVVLESENRALAEEIGLRLLSGAALP